MGIFKHNVVKEVDLRKYPDCCWNCEWRGGEDWWVCQNPDNWEPNTWEEADEEEGTPEDIVFDEEECTDLSVCTVCPNHKRSTP